MKRKIISLLRDCVGFSESMSIATIDALNKMFDSELEHVRIYGTDFNLIELEDRLILNIDGIPRAQIVVGVSGKLISSTNRYLIPNPKPRCIDAFGNTCTEQDLDRRVQKKMYYEDV